MAEGLTCLIKVGAEADQNYQNYILRGEFLSCSHFYETFLLLSEWTLAALNAHGRFTGDESGSILK